MPKFNALFDRKKSRLNPLPSVLIAAVIVFIIAATVFLLPSFERGKPSVTITPDIKAIGRNQTFTVTFHDQRSGLKNTTISLTQKGKTHVLSSTVHEKKGTRSQSVPVTIDAASLKLVDGPATLDISAVDHAIWGNQTSLVRAVDIDVTPAQIYVLTTMNYINPGGTCVVLFRTSKPIIESGVFVNETFFKAYPITASGKPFYVATFAAPLDAGSNTPRIRAFVKDPGGNETAAAIPFAMRKKTFRSDKVSLSNQFLERKMPEFQTMYPELRNKSLEETFAYVNKIMREENNQAIQEISRNSRPQALWEGAFLRMSNAAPMALFGDRRQWLFDGKQIGESIHEGIDLASVARAPIEAANNGVVLFAGPLGIYGSTVIIDHGMGLSSLYAHLSSVQVQEGQALKKGDVIGNSGMTGLAGGDHLHFSIMVGGEFVNPVEWWDPHWIENNVKKKLELAF